MRLEILRCPHSPSKEFIDYWAEVNYLFYKSVGYTETIDELKQSCTKGWKETYSHYKSQNLLDKIPVTKWVALDISDKPVVIAFASIQYKIINANQLPTFAYFFIYVKDDFRRKKVGTMFPTSPHTQEPYSSVSPLTHYP